MCGYIDCIYDNVRKGESIKSVKIKKILVLSRVSISQGNNYLCFDYYKI